MPQLCLSRVVLRCINTLPVLRGSGWKVRSGTEVRVLKQGHRRRMEA